MHPLARQGVEVGGEGGHQGFTLAGLHLGDAALVEDDAAHHLHPVGAQADDTPGGLPAGGEGLGEDVVQRPAVGQPLLQLRGLGLELGVGEGLELLLQGVHLVGDGVDGLQLPLGGGPENLGKQAHCVKHLSVVIWNPPAAPRPSPLWQGGLYSANRSVPAPKAPLWKGAGAAAGGGWGIPSIKTYNLNQYTTLFPTKKEQIVNFVR